MSWMEPLLWAALAVTLCAWLANRLLVRRGERRRFEALPVEDRMRREVEYLTRWTGVGWSEVGAATICGFVATYAALFVVMALT